MPYEIEQGRLRCGSSKEGDGASVPIYHFNVEDGQKYPDLVGSEFADLNAARTEAVHRSSTLLRDNAGKFWGGHGWKLVVTDSAGLVLFTLHFLAVSSPATQNYGQGAVPPDQPHKADTRFGDVSEGAPPVNS